MAERLRITASRLLGGGGVGLSAASSLPARSGMGLPVGEPLVPDKSLPTQDELIRDNGMPFPEPYIKGLGFFATLGLLAACCVE